jgi:hypothetical protein
MDDSCIDEDEAPESCRERIIRALDTILFEAAGVERAIDGSRPSEIDARERRDAKTAARRIFEEADRLMTWATRPAKPAPVN